MHANFQLADRSQSASLSPLHKAGVTLRIWGGLMRRREFITLTGCAAVAWPIAARAQQLPTIGLLGANSSSTQRQWTEAFVQRLRELGWTDGSTVAIEFRWSE